MDLRQQNQRSSRVTFRNIRKYSLPVCLIESLIILIFLAYILFFPSFNKDINTNYSKISILKQFSSEDGFVSNNYRTYSNTLSATTLTDRKQSDKSRVIKSCSRLEKEAALEVLERDR